MIMRDSGGVLVVVEAWNVATDGVVWMTFNSWQRDDGAAKSKFSQQAWSIQVRLAGGSR